MPVELARPGDFPAVRALFRATVALGRPLPFEADAARLLDAYERLCLDWYLEPANAAAAGVLRDAPRAPVQGYALVCLADADFARWQRRAAARFLAAAASTLCSWRRRPASRFARARVADGWASRRPPASVRGLPHAHLNAAPDRRGLPGRPLADFVDAVCAAAGHDAWYGEINARAGRREAAITRRWGGEVVHREPNRTLSWLVGEPVVRLTVRRAVPAAETRARPAA
jgi:hypothetical protein